MVAQERNAFGQRLRTHRSGRDFSVEELGARAELDYKAIDAIERGERFPQHAHFQRICDALELTLDERRELSALRWGAVLPAPPPEPAPVGGEPTPEALRAVLRLLRIPGLPGDGEGRAADLEACAFIPMRLTIGLLKAVRDFHGDITLNGAWTNVVLSLALREPYAQAPRPDYAERFASEALDCAQRALKYVSELGDPFGARNYLLRALALDRRAMVYHLLKDYSLAGNSYLAGARVLGEHQDDADARSLAAWIDLNHLLLRIDGEQPYKGHAPGDDAREAAILLACHDTFALAKDWKALWHIVVGAIALAASRATRGDWPRERDDALFWHLNLPQADGQQTIGPTYFRLLERYRLIEQAFGMPSPESDESRGTSLEVILAEVVRWLRTLTGDPGGKYKGA